MSVSRTLRWWEEVHAKRDEPTEKPSFTGVLRERTAILKMKF